MKLEELIEELRRIAVKNNWHLKYAKFGELGHQNLLMHSLSVMSIALRIAEVIGLEQEKYEILVISGFLHDALKSSDRWQRAIKERGSVPEDFWQRNPEELNRIIDQYSDELGIPDHVRKAVKDIIYVVESIESVENLLEALKSRPDSTVAHIIELADKIGSFKEPMEVERVSSDSKLATILRKFGLVLDYHQVDIVRGITTQLLHKGIMKAYEKAGYTPVAFFSTGTIYIGKRENVREITESDIIECVNEAIRSFYERNAKKLGEAAYGAIGQTVIKVPEFLFFSDATIKSFWEFVSGKFDDVKKYIINMTIIRNSIINLLGQNDEVKNVLNELRKELYEKYGIEDHIFDLSLKIIHKSSKDEKEVLVKGILNSALGKKESDLKEELKEIYLNFTLKLLKIGQEKYNLNKRLCEISKILISDLIHPVISGGAESRERILDESFSKYSEGKENKPPLCVLCGRPAERKAIASLVGEGAETFLNLLRGGRIIGGDAKAWLCDLCYAEFEMRSILGGGGQKRFEEIIYILPQISIGFLIVEKLKQSVEHAIANWQVTNGIEGNYLHWAEKIVKEPEEIDPLSNWSELFNILIDKKKQKQNERKIKKIIKELLESNEGYREILEKTYGDISEELILERYLDNSLKKDLVDRSTPNSLEKAIGMAFIEELERKLREKKVLVEREIVVSESPNYILIGMQKLRSYNESEASSMIRKLFIGAFQALVFQSTVIFASKNDVLRRPHLISKGYVKIPHNIIVKELLRRYRIGYTKVLGKEFYGWVGFDDIIRTLKILGAAVLVEDILRRAGADYGANTLLEILKRSPGVILNRFVQNVESKSIKREALKLLKYLNILNKNHQISIS